MKTIAFIGAFWGMLEIGKYCGVRPGDLVYRVAGVTTIFWLLLDLFRKSEDLTSLLRACRPSDESDWYEKNRGVEHGVTRP